MPQQLQSTYINLIKRCYELRDSYREEDLTAFWGRKGLKAVGNLMVVGRAVNGWDDLMWKKNDLRDLHDIEPRVVRMRELAETPCPMKWVNDYWQTKEKGNYNTARSPFWRVIRRVTLDLGAANVEEEWPSYVMWTNLYKVSPKVTGNPSNGLCELQRDICGGILDTEIRLWNPKRILFLTDMDWTSWFLNRLNASPDAGGQGKHVQWTGTMAGPAENSIRLVVTKRPERKPEDAFVSEVVKAFS